MLMRGASKLPTGHEFVARVSNHQMFETKRHRAVVSSNEEACNSFKSRPYLTSHVIRIEKKLTCKRH